MGTIFLDEIGELTLDMQGKLLRVLENRTVQRVGDQEWRKIDVRIVSATHRDLESMVNEGKFRRDLYYRLRDSIEVSLPSLRDHAEDIPLLVKEIASKFDGQRPIAEITAYIERRYASYLWPGNVRELRGIVHKLRLSGTDFGDDILPQIKSSKGGVRGHDSTSGASYQDAKADFERDYFSSLYEDTHGNISEMARRSGMKRDRIVGKLIEHGIRSK